MAAASDPQAIRRQPIGSSPEPPGPGREPSQLPTRTATTRVRPLRVEQSEPHGRVGKPLDRVNRADVPPTGSADNLAARLEAPPPNHPSSPDIQDGDTTRKAGDDRKDSAAVTVIEHASPSADPVDGREDMAWVRSPVRNTTN